jgi:hypothetical protein
MGQFGPEEMESWALATMQRAEAELPLCTPALAIDVAVLNEHC